MIDVPVFNPAVFKAEYPQFASMSDDTLQLLYDRVVPLAMPIIGLLKPQYQAKWWNVAEAHMAQIEQSGVNGRVSNATEGSVSGQTEFTNDDDLQAWWDITPFGQQIWQIMRTRNMMKGGARYIR